VVDAAMCDGAASLITMFFDMTATGRWKEEREANMLDGGAHFYGVYECKDGGFISIGSIEPQFYAQLRELAGLTDAQFDGQMDPKNWGPLRDKLTTVFKTKTRDQWCAIMEGTDVCFAPVLTMTEATRHPHMVARGVFVQNGGHTQPGPAPRFSRTPSSVREMQTGELAAQAKAWAT
ncbi:MAG: L-carnitine dehydratase/bile acid-inducible protein, partial [Tardiphaga sp.]|nr:L-carnitine dehydratase/bile acid-inducible protein [Tardiphaga sp.]